MYLPAYLLDKGSVFDSIMRWTKPKAEESDNNPTGYGEGGGTAR